MERRRRKAASTEELAIVKAAAWAWYQHGSGSKGKTVREFDLTRTRRAPGPSRYKQEAMKIADNNTRIITGPPKSQISLLDPYEVGRISKHLEYLIESASDNYYDESHAARGQEHRKKESLPESRKKKKSKLRNGFLARHSSICGSKEDVVQGTILAGPRLPHSELVVGLAKCRPRTKKAK